MSDIELDPLVTLWRQELDADGLRALHRSAQAANRRARFAALFDYAVAAVLIGAIAVAIALYPVPEVVAAGALVAAMLAWGQLRQRRLRQAELQSLKGDMLAMLDAALASNEAALKRAAFGLVLIGPATLMGAMLAFVLDTKGGAELASPSALGPLTGTILAGAAAFALLAAVVRLTVTIRRRRREMQRLLEMRDSYLKELESSRHAAG